MFNIAIDGPAGAGKSTAAKIVAAKLGILYLDTGAMYRAIGLKALRRGINTRDAEKVAEMLPDTVVEIKHIDKMQNIFLDGENVTHLIREHNVSMAASDVSAIPAVRLKLVELQRQIAKQNSCILDGRDIGTYVLPDAEFKFYITATAQESQKAIADETGNRLQQIADKLDEKIGSLELLPQHPTDTASTAKGCADNDADITTIIAGQSELKAKIDALSAALGYQGEQTRDTTLLERSIAEAFAEINVEIKALKNEITNFKENNATLQANAVTPPVDIDNAATATVQSALLEFENKMNLIAKDVMVMRNSTHSILKNMETQLIDRSSKEGRASLIIATGALVAVVVVLLKLYGTI